MRKRVDSLLCAVSGVVCTLRTEPNLRIHAAAAVAVAAAAAALGVGATQWALLTLCVGGVVSLECLNSALERLADRVTTERDPLIGRAKDAAAGGVLIAAVASAVVGLLVFVPATLDWWAAR